MATHDLSAFVLTEMPVWIWYLAVETIEGRLLLLLNDLLVVRGRVTAVGVDPMLVVGVVRHADLAHTMSYQCDRRQSTE